jgi:hypothetical protein
VNPRKVYWLNTFAVCNLPRFLNTDLDHLRFSFFCFPVLLSQYSLVANGIIALSERIRCRLTVTMIAPDRRDKCHDFVQEVIPLQWTFFVTRVYVTLRRSGSEQILEVFKKHHLSS